jgi:hypothetical protein
VSEHFQELFEANPLPFQRFSEIDQSFVDVLVTLIITKCFCSGDDLPHIGLSPVIGVEIEQHPKIFNLFLIESGVIFDNSFSP